MEKIIDAITSDPGFRKKWLIGGLLASIPVVNLLIFTYLFRYVGKIMAGGSLRLPVWRFDDRFWKETPVALLAAFIYMLLPLVIAGFLTWILKGLFLAMGLSLLANTLAWFPLTLTVMLSWPLLLAALVHFHEHEDAKALWDWNDILRSCLQNGRKIAPGLFMFLGLLGVGWPLLGFVFFLGMGPFAAYMTTLLLNNKNY